MSGTYYPPQHGRTHCQGGSDPIPISCFPPGAFPWVRLKLYTRDVSDLTWTTVPWRYLDYDPALVTEDVDFSWSEQNVGLTHNIWQITSRKRGFYFYDCHVRVEQPGSNITTDGGFALRMTDTISEIDHLYIASDWFDEATFASGYMGETEHASGYLRLSGVTYVESTNLVWKPQFFQSSGVTKALDGEYFLLMRLLDADAADWTELTTT